MAGDYPNASGLKNKLNKERKRTMKHRIRKTLSLALALIMLLSMVPLVYATEDADEFADFRNGWLYKYSTDNTPYLYIFDYATGGNQ